MKIFKLGVKVKDSATNLEGALMHYQLMDGANWYNFQPSALNPETGEPAHCNWISEGRVQGGEEVEFDLPVALLGTKAKDKITGFKGIVTSIILHINGCLHVEIQPEGKNAKTGAANKPHDFDIRTLEGPGFKVLSQKEIDASRKEKPSPVSHSPLGPRPR